MIDDALLGEQLDELGLAREDVLVEDRGDQLLAVVHDPPSRWSGAPSAESSAGSSWQPVGRLLETGTRAVDTSAETSSPRCAGQQ